MQRGIIAARSAEHLQTAIGDNFVDVHVRRCACAALEHVEGEGVPVLVCDDLLADPADQLTLCWIKVAEPHIRPGGGHLHIRERPDEMREVADPYTGNREIGDAACGLRPIIGSCRYRHRSKGVHFDAFWLCRRCQGKLPCWNEDGGQ
ncbi:hypothetical protein D3C71_1777990 [compost metagenome]